MTSDDVANIPEVWINPLQQRVTTMLGNSNFKVRPCRRCFSCLPPTEPEASPLQEFAYTLSFFSPRASRRDKLQFMFRVYDVDGDGLVGREDMEIILRQLGGSSLTGMRLAGPSRSVASPRMAQRHSPWLAADQDIRDIVDRAFHEVRAPVAGISPQLFEEALASLPLHMNVEVPQVFS